MKFSGDRFLMCHGSWLSRTSLASPSWLSLCQQFLDHIATDVGKSKIAALELESQLGMVQAQQMKNCGLNVVDMNLVLGDVEPELIGASQRLPRSDAGSGKPHSEGVDVMVPPERLTLFPHRRPSKLTSPDHERLIR